MERNLLSFSGLLQQHECLLTYGPGAFSVSRLQADHIWVNKGRKKIIKNTIYWTLKTTVTNLIIMYLILHSKSCFQYFLHNFKFKSVSFQLLKCDRSLRTHSVGKNRLLVIRIFKVLAAWYWQCSCSPAVNWAGIRRELLMPLVTACTHHPSTAIYKLNK